MPRPGGVIMTNSREQLDPIEKALLELHAADRAQLFCRTQIDGRRLLTRPTRSGSRHIPFRLLAAAAVVMAIGVWTWMFSVQLAALRQRVNGTTGAVAEVPAEARGGFYECFNGPTDVVPPGCREHDYDTDGDVDLADFGAYQLAYANVTR